MKLAKTLLAAGLAALLVWFVAQSLMHVSARRVLDQTLLVTTRSVEAEVDRFRSLPGIAAEDARVRHALRDTGERQAANLYLETVAALSGAEELYLIDASGETIAASSWNREDSFIGQNYGFRPYFREAVETGRGRFYAIGTRSGVPGYYLSYRLTVDGLVGVVVVKLNLQPLQDTWRAANADVALADEHGVVFLSARADWRYRPLLPLADDTLAHLVTTRAYDGVGLGDSAALLTTAPDGLDARGSGWFARITPMPSTGWQVIAAQSSDRLQLVAVGWAALAALAALAVAVILQVREQRRQIVAMRLSQSEKLEGMVVARTADLAREIDARTQAEAHLRATQEALVHTEKMAALGRMSAAIVHEISQPLAAMEATLSAAELGAAHDTAATLTRLGKARGLIRRMQRTTQHLKSFVRKEPVERTLIDLCAPVESALDLVAPRARALGVTPALHLPAGRVPVMAGVVRIEQIVVNLVLNALDAVADTPDARVSVALSDSDGIARLRVSDTGTGIAEADLARVTEPFFSTKVAGESLGLGLAICQEILAGFGGSLDIQSVENEGTIVTVTLPLATSPLATPDASGANE